MVIKGAAVSTRALSAAAKTPAQCIGRHTQGAQCASRNCRGSRRGRLYSVDSARTRTRPLCVAVTLDVVKQVTAPVRYRALSRVAPHPSCALMKMERRAKAYPSVFLGAAPPP